MKTRVFLFVIVSTFFSLQAQIQKKKLVLDFTGGFTDNVFSSGITTTNFNKLTRTLNLNLEAGYTITNHLILGAGFSYGWIKENAKNIFLYNGYLSIETSEIKMNISIPSVFLKYYIPLNEKLFFGTSLNLGLGIVESSEKWNKVSNRMLPADTIMYDPIEGDIAQLSTNNNNSNTNFKLIGIMPELVYYIKPKIGLVLQPGILQCTLDEEWKPFWYLSVKPKDWNFGVQLCF